MAELTLEEAQRGRKKAHRENSRLQPKITRTPPTKRLTGWAQGSQPIQAIEAAPVG